MGLPAGGLSMEFYGIKVEKNFQKYVDGKYALLLMEFLFNSWMIQEFWWNCGLVCKKSLEKLSNENCPQ